MRTTWLLPLSLAFVACAPGYIKSADLESRNQGPTACAKSCEDIGMRMTALVLVGNEQPGCVCQPVVKESPQSPPAAAPAPAVPPAPAAADAPQEGAAA